MSRTATQARQPESFPTLLAVSMLILGAALAVVWARAIALSPAAEPWPVPTVATPTVTQLAQAVTPSRATPTLMPPTRTPRPTATPTSPLPQPTDDIAPARCRELSGKVVTDGFFSRVSETELQYLIYLPPCYDRTNIRYPTLYLIHGSDNDERHWEELGLFDAMDAGLRATRFAPTIIVLPDGDWNLYNNTSGGPNSYEAQMVDELIPLIDRTYRTDAQRKMRAIGGISRGGVWSLEIGFFHPDLFAIVGGHSAALNVNLAPPSLDPIQLTDLPSLKTQHIWLDAGETDYVQPGVERLHQALDKDQVPHTYRVWPGAHENALWAAHLSEYLEFYTQTWPK